MRQNAPQGPEMSDNAPQRLYLMQVGRMPDYGIPIVCYLVQTGDGQNILIDSGLPEVMPEGETEFANGQDAHRANPGLTLRTAAGGAAPGVHFFWLLFFVQAKKSDPLARMRAEKRRDAVRAESKTTAKAGFPLDQPFGC